jgi:hypothetical protein
MNYSLAWALAGVKELVWQWMAHVYAMILPISTLEIGQMNS